MNMEPWACFLLEVEVGSALTAQSSKRYLELNILQIVQNFFANKFTIY
jgi:hypothetical protein